MSLSVSCSDTLQESLTNPSFEMVDGIASSGAAWQEVGTHARSSENPNGNLFHPDQSLVLMSG